MSNEISRIISDISRPTGASLVMAWLPDGRKNGEEWVARNPTRADGRPGSFSVNMTSFKWADFATDDKGGDLVSLYAYLHGLDKIKGGMAAAAADVAAQAGIATTLAQEAGGGRKAKAPPKAQPAEKAASGAGKPPQSAKAEKPQIKWRVTNTYSYEDASGALVCQTRRLEEIDPPGGGKPQKTFRQRRPDGNGGWINSVKGIELVPYRLPELLEAISAERVVIFGEGEKVVDRCWQAGIPATTNPMGSKKWFPELTPYFRDADVVIVPDNDEPGRKHAQRVGQELFGTVRRIRILDLPAIEALPAKADIYDWLQAGGTAERLYDLVEARAEAFVPAPPESKFGALPFWELDRPGGREHQCIIKGVITANEVGMTAGPSKSGKSFFVIDMSLAVARGINWRGRRTMHGGVLYQAGEGQLGLKKRLRAYRKKHGIKPSERIPFFLIPEALNLHDGDEYVDAFIEECLAYKAYILKVFGLPLLLIVIDTLSTATPGADENSSKDISRVLARCKRIKDATGAHVHLVHHMNAAGARPRGHSSIGANLENVLLITRDDKRRDADSRPIRTAYVDKQKDGEDGVSFEFVLERIEYGIDEHGDKIWSCVVKEADLYGAGQKSKARGETVIGNPMDRIALRALENATIAGGETPPAKMKLSPGLRVVRFPKWLEEFHTLSFNDDIKQSKKILAGIGARLLARGRIGRDNPFVWLPKAVGDPQPEPPTKTIAETLAALTAAPEPQETAEGTMKYDDAI